MTTHTGRRLVRAAGALAFIGCLPLALALYGTHQYGAALAALAGGALVAYGCGLLADGEG